MSGATAHKEGERCKECGDSLTDKIAHYVGKLNRAGYCLGCCPLNH